MVSRFTLGEERFRREFGSLRLSKLYQPTDNISFNIQSSVLFRSQTSTTVSITHATMVDHARMVSTVTIATAHWDLLEITVKQVYANNSRRQS